MDTEKLAANTAFVKNEIAWFRQVLDLRMKWHASGETGDPVTALETPPLPSSFRTNRSSVDSPSSAAWSVSHGGVLPTGETAMFLLAGEDVEARLRYLDLFHHEHYLYHHNVLRLDHRHREEPPLSSALHLTAEYRERLTTGRSYHPPYSPEFPAQRIITPYEWDDVVPEIGLVHQLRGHERRGPPFGSQDMGSQVTKLVIDQRKTHKLVDYSSMAIALISSVGRGYGESAN